jgi:hypothetical protein
MKRFRVTGSLRVSGAPDRGEVAPDIPVPGDSHAPFALPVLSMIAMDWPPI